MTASGARERWLEKAANAQRAWFPAETPAGPCRVSVGWPSKKATSSRNRRIGECWYGSNAADGIPQVFISPALADPIEVLATLLHELVHVATPGAGHKAPFARLAKGLGLTGKMTATVPGDDLRDRLNALLKRLGPWPHAALTPGANIRKQGTRLLKAECSCGYIIRVTAKWADMGLPICPCGDAFTLED